MIACRVRRLESISTGTRPNSIVYAGDPLGVDWIGLEVREDFDVAVVSIEHQGDSWLIAYREVRVRPELTPAT